MSSIRPTEGRMDESSGSSNSLPPFLSKIYEMVDDPSMDFVVSWSSTGRSFIVWNQLEFLRDLLPKYFKHNNFSSFIRQLNTYGFRKIDPEQWEFASDDFVRGQPHLLKNIHRRKPVHSHSLQNLQSQVNAAPLSEVERQSLKDKVRKLKQERELLYSKLQKRDQEKKEYELQMLDFKERLQGLQCRQKSLLSLVASALQNAGPALNLGPQLDVQERKRRLRFGYLFDEFVAGSNHLKTCRCWDSTTENNNDSCESSCYMEKLERLESSLTAWGDIVHQYHVQDNLIPDNISIGYVDSPSISCVQLDVDVPPKSPGIDMNSELPASPSTADTLKEKTDKTNASVRTGVNDVFWEQFLTENPGSSQEVHSERDVFDGRKSDAGPGDHFDLWWNLGNVNNPAGKTGHLTRT